MRRSLAVLGRGGGSSGGARATSEAGYRISRPQFTRNVATSPDRAAVRPRVDKLRRRLECGERTGSGRGAACGACPRYALPASASSNGEKSSTKVELIVILSTANARLDRAAGVIEQHQATRRRLPALVCQQSHKAAADEVAKMNLPGVCMRAWEVAAAAENGFIQQLRG